MSSPTTGSLKIIKSGMLTLLQDSGRKGFAFYGIPKSGCLDIKSANFANALLQKEEDGILIECHIIPPHIEFLFPTQIVISGADFQWEINGEPIKRNNIINVETEDILTGGPSKNGSRGYIAINGKIKAKKHYDSYSTYPKGALGGMLGKALKRDDILEWEQLQYVKKTIDFEVELPSDIKIPIIKGPEFELLTDASKKLVENTQFNISHVSNRMGARLGGNVLRLTETHLKHSVPVLPGIIQLPPIGHPVVLLQDGQTTGGYPRVGYIPAEHLSTFNQLMINEPFYFKLLDS